MKSPSETESIAAPGAKKRGQLDVDAARAAFPAFSEPSLEGFSHFENAGGSYACGPVIDQLTRYYTATKVQPKYPSAPARAAGAQMDRARSRMADWLNVPYDEVHFGPSTTANVFVLAQAFRRHLSPGDEIIVTNQDHEANIGAWRRLADDGLVVREWQVDPDTGELPVDGLDALLNERTRLVAFTECSNVIGRHHPVTDWVRRIHDAGAVAVVDGVAAASHGLPDVAALGADIYLFSLYKVYGPHLGVMTMRGQLNDALPPQGHAHATGSRLTRFTPAGPDHAQIASVNGLFDYFESLHAHHFGPAPAAPREQATGLRALFTAHEAGLAEPLLAFLADDSRVRLLGPDQVDGRAPTVAFQPLVRAPAELAEALGQEGIGVGHGHFNAYRLMQALGIDPAAGVVRVSMVHYNTAGEVRRLLHALDRLFG